MKSMGHSGDICSAVLTEHATNQMAQRQVSEGQVRDVLQAPEQVLDVRAGRIVVQGVQCIGGRQYLIRVFVDVDRRPPEVVTVYRTSKIDKYRSRP
jgi:hypothetical protein